MPLIKCSDCNNDISDVAPHCPVCGKPNYIRKFKREVNTLLFVGIVFMPFIFCWFLLRRGHSKLARISTSLYLAALLALLSNTPLSEFLSYSTFSTNKGKQPSVISSIIEQANKPRHDSIAQSFNIGETIKNETFEVTINSVKFLTNVGGIIFNEKAADGGLFVAIKWKYKNISSKPINMFNAPTLSLLDSNGAKYDNDLGASIAYASQSNDTQKTLSDTNPGITVTGSEVFEVSQEQFDAEKWRLIVKTMDGDISIKLGEYINKRVSESNEKQLKVATVNKYSGLAELEKEGQTSVKIVISDISYGSRGGASFKITVANNTQEIGTICDGNYSGADNKDRPVPAGSMMKVIVDKVCTYESSYGDSFILNDTK
jgi:hypothetical protein